MNKNTTYLVESFKKRNAIICEYDCPRCGHEINSVTGHAKIGWMSCSRCGATMKLPAALVAIQVEELGKRLNSQNNDDDNIRGNSGIKKD